MIIALATYNHFYELPVYKKCRAFRKEVFKLVKDSFPKQAQYLLTAQLLASTRSVTANIAEGFGRFHYQENIQFCRQGRGSLTETLEHLITAHDCGSINHDTLKRVHTYYKVCLKELNSYIQYLKSVKSKPIINNE